MILFLLSGAFMLGLCIFIHELGHYLMGRLVGIKAEIFSIGYGRGIWKKKIGDTTWQITAIPLGGYVKFYGDDYQDPSPRPGGFLSAPPLTRIIPVLGGPLFNLILGFLVFVLIHSLSGPLAPNIQVHEAFGPTSAAYKSGLRNGDTVLSVNGKPVKDFIDIQTHVALSSGAPLDFKVNRAGKEMDFKVTPEVHSSGTSYIGIRVPGKKFLEVNYPTGALWSYRFMSIFRDVKPPASMRALPHLDDGDVIESVNGREINSVDELKSTLGEYHGQTVKVVVRRQQLPWLTPLYLKKKTIDVPTTGAYRLEMRDIRDLKYNQPVPERNLESIVDAHERGLSYIKINGKATQSFESLYKRFGQPARVKITIEGNEYSARIQTKKIGVFGFRTGYRIESVYAEQSGSFGSIIASAGRDTWKNIVIYPVFFKKLFTGKISFIDNAIGPVGMFAVAGRFVKSGLHEYLQWLAAISIALMVMNLLPFPIVDGGHIVFFLYEAVAGKPVSPRIMDAMYRFGFTALLFLGIWVMYRDILTFVIQ